MGLVVINSIKAFISYSSHDKEIADEICTYLEKHGKKCWIAPRDITAGSEYGEEIINGIETSDIMILLFSAASNNSQHVLREVERAVNKKIPVIAFKIENCVLSKSMEYFLLSNQWLDATAGVQGMLEILSSSVDKVYSLSAKTSADGVIPPTNTIRVSNKAVPIVLSVIAVGVVAIAVILAVTASGKNELPVSQGETSSATVSETQTEVNATSVGETETSKTDELPEFQVGEFVDFARYNPSTSDAEGVIRWQIIDIDERNETMKMISAEIIDIKPYDCAEGGKYGFDCDGIKYDYEAGEYSNAQYMEFFGSNDWLSSDLWAWLNATGAPHYTGLFFNDEATDECANAYGNQLGFLSSFSKSELNLLFATEPVHNMKERVTLLSTQEVQQYAANDKFILHPSVTEEAASSDESMWYASFLNRGVPDYIWVTRTPCDYNKYEVYYVESCEGHDMFSLHNAAISGFGIRPVITIDLRAIDVSQVGGEGSLTAPYTLVK